MIGRKSQSRDLAVAPLFCMVAVLKWRLIGRAGIDSLLMKSRLRTMSVLLAFNTTCSKSITCVRIFTTMGVKIIQSIDTNIVCLMSHSIHEGLYHVSYPIARLYITRLMCAIIFNKGREH